MTIIISLSRLQIRSFTDNGPSYDLYIHEYNFQNADVHLKNSYNKWLLSRVVSNCSVY